MRTKLGLIGAYLSCTVFGITLLTFVVLELSFHIWAVGQYFAGHSERLIDIFIESLATATAGIFLSSFGKGNLRIIGVSLGALTITAVVLIFWMNQ